MAYFKSILLISDGIKTNDFDGNFILNLLNKHSNLKAAFLWHSTFEEQFPVEFTSFIEQKRLKIYYGTSFNKALVEKIINDNKVNFIKSFF